MVIKREVLEHTGDSRYRYQVGQWHAAREPDQSGTGEVEPTHAVPCSETYATSSPQ